VTEAKRVTTYDGKVYLSAMNRWEILEPHWLIPFFTWTPRFMWDRFFPLAVRFSPIAKKGLDQISAILNTIFLTPEK